MPDSKHTTQLNKIKTIREQRLTRTRSGEPRRLPSRWGSELHEMEVRWFVGLPRNRCGEKLRKEIVIVRLQLGELGLGVAL